MTTIQLRRATAASWTSINPILALGEVGLETDTYKLKVGDGVSQWNALSYYVHSWNDLLDRPSNLVAGGGNANGYATLDGGGKVPYSQLPSSIMSYLGVWNASTNSPTLADGGSFDTGDVYRVGTGGTRNLGSGSITWEVGDYAIYNGTTWERSDSTDAVTQVAGYTGIVTQDDITGLSSTGIIKRTGTNTLAVATGGTDYVVPGSALGTPTSGNVSNCIGQVADVSMVSFGSLTTRAVGLGDNPFGIKLMRSVYFNMIVYRCYTADASGNLVVELRKNGTTVANSSATIAAANQVAGASVSGTFSFAGGDIITAYVTGVGTTPGKGLVVELGGVTTT